MKVRGKLHSITRDQMTGKQYIAFELSSTPKGVDSIQEKDLDIEAVEHREKRSLQANACYWSIVGEIAAFLNASRPFVHNMLLRDYGTLEQVAGENVFIWVVDDPDSDDWTLESPLYHLYPTSYSKLRDGKLWREYMLIKGSSQYDTLEMSRLINGAVTEAETMGIDTISDDELERMMRAYEKHNTDL